MNNEGPFLSIAYPSWKVVMYVIHEGGERDHSCLWVCYMCVCFLMAEPIQRTSIQCGVFNTVFTSQGPNIAPEMLYLYSTVTTILSKADHKK